MGFLQPLNNNLEEEVGQEESSIPKILLSKGLNVVGRNCIPVTDKRLSRKHLSINVASDGSSEVSVVNLLTRSHSYLLTRSHSYTHGCYFIDFWTMYDDY